jgi:ClpP class serine protease
MSEVTDPAVALPRALHAPHFEQYFGAWACQESFFRAAFDRVARMDLRVHVEQQRSRASDDGAAAVKPDGAKAEGEDEPMAPRPTNYPVTESGIAVLQLSGVLMKHVGSLEEGTSTVQFRRKLRAAMSNPAISGILIIIDSPGGAVAGTFELAEDSAWR